MVSITTRMSRFLFASTVLAKVVARCILVLKLSKGNSVDEGGKGER